MGGEPLPITGDGAHLEGMGRFEDPCKLAQPTRVTFRFFPALDIKQIKLKLLFHGPTWLINIGHSKNTIHLVKLKRLHTTGEISQFGQKNFRKPTTNHRTLQALQLAAVVLATQPWDQQPQQQFDGKFVPFE